MERDTLALIISILSLCVGGAALVWNIYRELALKARLKTSLAIAEWSGVDGKRKKLLISVSNLGPGPVQLQGFTVKPPKRRAEEFDVRFYVVPVDWDDPMTTRLPVLLTVGQTANLVVRYSEDLFFAGGASRVGLTDSFGRVHWTPARDGRRALAQFKSDFPEAS